MANGKPYSELGEVMDRLARRRSIRGPYEIERVVRARMGRGPNGSAWSQILYGQTQRPKLETINLFADAFELTEDERTELATVYTFRGLVAA